jgi:hypothetical protein
MYNKLAMHNGAISNVKISIKIVHRQQYMLIRHILNNAEKINQDSVNLFTTYNRTSFLK